MKIAILFIAAWALCLIVTPQPSPSSQKATNTAQQNAQPDKHIAKLSPSPTPSARKDTPQNPTNQNGNAVKGSENERTVRVVGLPPRSAGDTIALVCTIVLTIVGVVGILAALCTLRALKQQTIAIRKQGITMKRQTMHIARQALSMRRQTTLLRQSADAAKTSAESAETTANALIATERAWVDVRLAKQGPAIYFVEITNYGRTVARIKEIGLVCSLSPGSNGTITTYQRDKLLVPNLPWNAFTLNLVQALGNETLQKVRSGELALEYCAIVRYESIRPDCQSECRYFYNTAVNCDCLVPVEAPEYNTHT